MKYFTSATLALLTLNSFFLAVSASGTTDDKGKTSESGSTTVPVSNAPAPAPPQEIIENTYRTGSQIFETIKNVFNTPEIKGGLAVPTALDPSSLVQIEACRVRDSRQFRKDLFAAKNTNAIDNVVLCPGSIPFLVELTSVELLENVKNDQLRDILSALMLRRFTLLEKYSRTYMDINYTLCHNALWDRVWKNSAGTEFWPCTPTACDAEKIKANFRDFVEETRPCNAVLTEQLEAYADEVAKTAVRLKITMASVLREKIIQSLIATPNLSVPISAAYDKLMESSKTAAVESITKILDDVKKIIEEQGRVGKGGDVYTKAETNFNDRLKRLLGTNGPKSVKGAEGEAVLDDTPAISSPPTKTNKSTGSTTAAIEPVDPAPAPTHAAGDSTATTT